MLDRKWEGQGQTRTHKGTGTPRTKMEHVSLTASRLHEAGDLWK